MQQMMKILVKNQLSPNQVYLMWCLSEGIIPSNINVHQEIRVLKSGDWIIGDKATLSKKAYDVLKDLEGCFKKNVSTRAAKEAMGDDFMDKLKAYVELFPDIKLPSGVRARADLTNLKANFTWFFKTYEYDWDTVLKATDLYVGEYELKNFLYMRNSQFFISKMNPQKFRESELANYCDRIKNGDVDENNLHFSEKVV